MLACILVAAAEETERLLDGGAVLAPGEQGGAVPAEEAPVVADLELIDVLHPPPSPDTPHSLGAVVRPVLLVHAGTTAPVLLPACGHSKKTPACAGVS